MTSDLRKWQAAHPKAPRAVCHLCTYYIQFAPAVLEGIEMHRRGELDWTELHAYLRAQGYPGSYMALHRHVHACIIPHLATSLPPTPPPRTPPDQTISPTAMATGSKPGPRTPRPSNPARRRTR